MLTQSSTDIEIFNRKQFVNFFIVLVLLMTLAGCHSNVSNLDANQAKAQELSSISNTNLYNGYIQEINELPNSGVKRMTIVNFEVAQEDYWNFTQTKIALDTRVKADPALKATQKAALSQLIQNTTGQDCDAIIDSINAKFDNYYHEAGCQAINEPGFLQCIIFLHGPDAAAAIVHTCQSN